MGATTMETRRRSFWYLVAHGEYTVALALGGMALTRIGVGFGWALLISSVAVPIIQGFTGRWMTTCVHPHVIGANQDPVPAELYEGV